MNKSAEEFLDALDEDLMKQTFEAVHQDYLAGCCIPHSQLMDYRKQNLDGGKLNDRLSDTGKKAVIGNEIKFISGATIEIDRSFLETVE